MSAPKMKSKDEIRQGIIDLAGPGGRGLSVQGPVAQRVLAWVLGEYGDISLTQALKGDEPPASEPEVKPHPIRRPVADAPQA